MSEREAAMCSMREYRMRREGKEKEMQRSYEVARWMVYEMLSPYYGAGKRPASPKDFCRFPWEKGGITTEEEAKDAMRRSAVSEEEARVLDKVFRDLNKRNG